MHYACYGDNSKTDIIIIYYKGISKSNILFIFYFLIFNNCNCDEKVDINSDSDKARTSCIRSLTKPL